MNIVLSTNMLAITRKGVPKASQEAFKWLSVKPRQVANYHPGRADAS
jgi:hypothetical protein